MDTCRRDCRDNRGRAAYRRRKAGQNREGGSLWRRLERGLRHPGR